MNKVIAELLTDEGVPNMDALTFDQLRAFADATSKARDYDDRMELAMAMFPELPEADVEDDEKLMGALQSLHIYATNAATAQRHRLKGEIDQALRFEARCDLVYKDLPPWARW